MVDTAGINDNAFLHPIQPTCANYALNGGLVNDNNLGRQSSAQWIRNAFRKFFAVIAFAAGVLCLGKCWCRGSLVGSVQRSCTT